MKIAVTGKGGSGKTTISGTLARHLAGEGREVIAIDADPNPNLGTSVGLAPEDTEAIVPILNGLLASGFTHHDVRPTAEELLTRFGVAAPDGIVLIATARIERPTDACLCCGSHTTSRHFFADVPDAGRVVIADLEAGLSDLVWANPGADDVVLVVTEPSAKSVQVALHSCRMAESLGVRRILGVASQWPGGDDASHLRDVLGVEVMRVGEDEAVKRADRAGLALIDEEPDSRAVSEIRALAEWLDYNAL
ncbi:MAG TPA: AAA family ATPase [Acidimicrobiales bacterium]|nr:AAA family ATPase [Acidimicrobiales bacterium]